MADKRGAAEDVADSDMRSLDQSERFQLGSKSSTTTLVGFAQTNELYVAQQT